MALQESQSLGKDAEILGFRELQYQEVLGILETRKNFKQLYKFWSIL